MITKRRRKRSYWLPILLILLFASGIYIWQLHQKVKISNQADLITPQVKADATQPPTAKPSVDAVSEQLNRIDAADLQKVVSDSLAGTSGTYAVEVKNLKTGEHFELNSSHVFESGSLYKLWVMGAVYEQEKAGNLDDSQVLSEDIPTLNQKFQIDPDLAEQTEGTITYSVHDALYQMITISDNYTALLLTEKIGLSKVADFLDEYNFNQSMVGTNGDDPTTTAADIAKFFEKLYDGQIVDRDYSNKMLDLLKMQKLNTKIPQQLPTDVVIAHKTGEIDTFTHDGGIVYTPNGDYIIVVMSDSDDPPAAEVRISDVSQAVYGYFTKGR